MFVFEDESSAPGPELKSIDERLPPAGAATDAEEEAPFVFEDALEAPEISIDESEAPEPAANAGEASAQLTRIDHVESTPAQDAALAGEIVELFLRLETDNYYELLGVPRTADDVAIRLAYHTLVKKFHVDHVRERLDAEMTEKALGVMQALTVAYETLSSPGQRVDYNRRLTGEGAELKERRITTILAAERAFNIGMGAMRKQDFPDAERAFREACDLFPEEGEYHAFLGWAQYQNRRRPAAERSSLAKKSIERALRLNPKGDKAYFFLGKILMQQPETREKARQMFALSFRYNKNNDEAKSELRRLQAEREKEHAEIAAITAAKAGFGARMKKDMDFDTVKRAVKKIFF